MLQTNCSLVQLGLLTFDLCVNSSSELLRAVPVIQLVVFMYVHDWFCSLLMIQMFLNLIASYFSFVVFENVPKSFPITTRSSFVYNYCNVV